MLTKNQQAILPSEQPIETQQCPDCKAHLPLDSDHFKPNQIMPTGYGKRCLHCLSIALRKRRDEARAEKMAKNMADLQETLNSSRTGSPVESELLSLMTARLGGVESVAASFVDDYMASEAGTTCARRWQEMFIGMVKRHTDRVGSKTDIRNMSTDRIREELNKKIRETIAGAIDENGILKMPKTG